MIAHTLKQVTLDHLKLNYYLSKRKKAKATLVFLHGVYNTHKLFYPLIKKLDTIFNIVALDFPGFGNSSADESFQPEQLVDLLHKFLLRIKMSNVYLVGFSLGGVVGIDYAAKYPDTIKGLVIIASPIRTSHIGLPYLQLINICKNSDVLEIIVSQKDSLIVREMVSFATALPDVKYLRYTKADLIKELVSKTNYGAVSKYCSYLFDYDVAPQLNKLKMPILAVYGENDQLCLGKYAPEIKALNPGAEVHIFPFFTHNAQIENASLISELIVEFFKGNQK